MAAPAAEAGWWDDAGRARPTTWEEIEAAPEKFVGLTVSLEIERLKRQHDGAWLDMRTGTIHGSGGGDAAARGDNPFRQYPPSGSWGMAYRDDGLELRPRAATTHRFWKSNCAGKFEVRAVVRRGGHGRFHLDVISVTGDGDPLTPEEAAEVRQADRFLTARNPGAAESTYRKLLEGRLLPTHVIADLHRKIGRACYEGRRLKEAEEAWSQAVAIEANEETSKRLAALREVLARPVVEPVARAPVTAPTLPASLGAPLPAGPALAPPAGLGDGPIVLPESRTRERPPAPEAAPPKPAAPKPLPVEEPEEPPPLPPPPKPGLAGPR